MQKHKTIEKNPQLASSINYEFLRKKGLQYIEQLGSDLWTDYNIHDPGITILELLCYAITDLGYRTSLDIKDLLAAPASVKSKEDPKRQGFFPAREILTNNPLSKNDFRKMLIDIDGIKNAWINCTDVQCGKDNIYVDFTQDKLTFDDTGHHLKFKGLYDVLLEFEDEEKIGNLNNGFLVQKFSFKTNRGYSSAFIEMRLPSWQTIVENLSEYKSLRNPKSRLDKINASLIKNEKNTPNLAEEKKIEDSIFHTVYIKLELTFKPDGDPNASSTIEFPKVPLKVWILDPKDSKFIKEQDILRVIQDTTASGISARYLQMIHRADEIIKYTEKILHNHRNLCEDYCNITAIGVQDVGICADIYVEADADKEAVLAEVYFRIEQYLCPDVKFYSLRELLDKGVPVEGIFEGPYLNNGFILDVDLDKADLNRPVYSSDIINLLMDIKGVNDVRSFVITKFDINGIQTGSAAWEMKIEHNHRPRFYAEASKILIYKNNLPFYPDYHEVSDTLQVIKGQNLQPKYSIDENNLEIPKGKHYKLNDYYPIQLSLPKTYGVSYEGLPDSLTPERKARAKQLKAYMMFYEQLLVNYLEQLAHVKDLFAIDESIDRSYFSRMIHNGEISNLDDIYNKITTGILKELAETKPEFLDRRNRFLDHLLARFAENFNEYSLMLFSYINNKPVTQEKLIQDKISFLKDIQCMSADRSKAINYKSTSPACTRTNISGLQLRIQKLLGMESIYNYLELYEEKDSDNKYYEQRWRLKNETGKIMLSSSTRYFDKDHKGSEKLALAEFGQVLKYICDPDSYDVKKVNKWVVNILNPKKEIIATRKQAFKSKAEAENAKQEIVDFGKKLQGIQKIFVVEHILLRPIAKSGITSEDEALLTVCIPSGCTECGEDDPYSFRLTVILSGELGIASRGMDFRRFAEKTIRMEVPAHIGLKICWVEDGQLKLFEDAWCAWLEELAKPEKNLKSIQEKLIKFLYVFNHIKSVYPEASLHDCRKGEDSERVFLGKTVI